MDDCRLEAVAVSARSSWRIVLPKLRTDRNLIRRQNRLSRLENATISFNIMEPSTPTSACCIGPRGSPNH